MKLNVTDFRRKCQFPLILALAGMPILAFISAKTVPETLSLIWVTPLAYVLLAWLCLVIPGKKRLIAGAAGVIVLLALGAAVLPVKESLVLMLGPVLYSVLLLAGLQFSGWQHHQEMSFGWFSAGIVTHAFLQIMINAAHKMNDPVYAPVEGPMILCFLAYLALMMLSLNRSSMDAASMGRQRIPVHMRRRNVALTIGFLVLVVLVAAAPAVIKAVEAAWDWLMRAIAWLGALLSSLLPEMSSGSGGMGGADMDMSGFGEVPEQSLLSKILEKIMMCVAAIAAVILLCLALRFLYKKLKILLKFLWGRLSEYAASASEDYEDEVTDTREDGECERINLLDRLKKRMVFVDEKKLTPVQRIRYRYLRLMYKHEDWYPGQTARETLPEAAAKLYERARYSEHPVSEDDAEQFVSGIKNV